MPKSTRIRESGDPHGEGADAERRQWVTRWKQWAVGQLPSTAPRAVKVELRVQVERALGRFAPGDDEEELHDVVLAAVDAATARLRADVEQGAREENRRASAALAGLFLEAALRKFPREAVAAMLQQPGYSRNALTQRLTRHLERYLKGEETVEEILARVTAWVERRLAEQPPPARPWRGTVAGAVGAAAALALTKPEIRDAARKGLTKARELALTLWQQRTAGTRPPEPP